MRKKPDYLSPAFTLIELLVVVAIISLLIAILLPTLQRAREQTKSVICTSHLRSLGQGVVTSAAENMDRLPGGYNNPDELPNGLFPGLYRNQGIKALMENEVRPLSYQTARRLQERQLTYRLRRMFQDSDAAANSITDEVSTCPVAASVNPDSNFARTPETVGYYVYPTHYVVNNVGTEGEQGGSVGNFRITNPPSYFGFSRYDDTPHLRALEEKYPPQKLSKINRPAEEWMIADAWYRPSVSPQFQELQQEGPYQWEYSGKAFPNFAIHFSGRVYEFIDINERRASSARIRDGKDDGETNTVFFDGHAEPVTSKTLTFSGWRLLYGFRGTVNPLMEAPPANHPVWSAPWE
jgi:prepilin-type N-terminal cleavage/methylation domain-containing protein/prepilin-type processing-associated H-X9-DG protein